MLKKYNTCDPKYYGRGVKNCGNSIKGFEKLDKLIKKEKKDEGKN